MPAHAFFSHATAAQLHGIPLPARLRDELPLHVSVPDGSAPREGRQVRGHHLLIDPGDVVVRRGLRVTSLERTICDLASALDDEDLIAAADNILWRRRLQGHRASRRSLHDAISRFRGRRGRARLAAVEPHLTDRSDSPPESVMRLRFIRAGLPAMLVNVEVVDAAGNPIATPDLQFEKYLMALDYEGDHHRTDLCSPSEGGHREVGQSTLHCRGGGSIGRPREGPQSTRPAMSGPPSSIGEPGSPIA
jgi:hypothetical protein